MNCISPTPAQTEALIDFLGLSKTAHANQIGFLEILGTAHFPVLTPAATFNLTEVYTRKLFLGEPGKEGSATQVFILHEKIGLTIEVLMDIQNHKRAMSVSVYALEDFDTVVHEATQAYINTLIEKVVNHTRGALPPQAVLECVKTSLANSELGALFEADRSATILQDAVEERSVRAFVPRG